MNLDQSAMNQVNDWFAAAEQLKTSVNRLAGLKAQQGNYTAVHAVTNVLTSEELHKLAQRITSAVKTCEQFRTSMDVHGNLREEQGREAERKLKGGG
jgi:hypothetical protein